MNKYELQNCLAQITAEIADLTAYANALPDPVPSIWRLDVPPPVDGRTYTELANPPLAAFIPGSVEVAPWSAEIASFEKPAPITLQTNDYNSSNAGDENAGNTAGSATFDWTLVA